MRRLALAVLVLVCLAPLARGQVLAPVRLSGPNVNLDLPPADQPLILHVFRPGHEKHEATAKVLDRLREAGRPFPFAEYYVLSPRGDETFPEFEESHDGVVYDPDGETIFVPFELPGFYTVIVDPRGYLTRIGYPGQYGYMGRLWTTAESLQIALEQDGRTVELRAAQRPSAPTAEREASAPPAEDEPQGPGLGWLIATPFLAVFLAFLFLARRWRRDARQRLGGVLELQPGLRCAICVQAVERHQSLVACPACVVVSHTACRARAGGCQTIGCPGSGRSDRFASRGTS